MASTSTESRQEGKSNANDMTLPTDTNIGGVMLPKLATTATDATIDVGATPPPAEDRQTPTLMTNTVAPNESAGGLPSADKLPCQYGDYELLQEIARGGMGVVYRARQNSLDRIVALKMILSTGTVSKNTVDRFYREAKAAARLDHPGIIPLYEIGQIKGQHYYTMSFIEGKSLKAIIQEKGALSPADAVVMMLPIVDAVGYAHKHGIIHRDLKPENVLLDGQGRPRVADFGLAKKLEGDAGLTATGQILGTPAYMAPEQAFGKEAQVGPASDVYALGGILYYLAAGTPPFCGDTMTEVLARVISQPPPSPRQHNPAISPELESLILRCLEKDVAKRIATTAEMAAFLRAEATKLGATIPDTSIGHGVFQPLQPRRSFSVLPWVALAVVLIAVGSGLGAYFAGLLPFGAREKDGNPNPPTPVVQNSNTPTTPETNTPPTTPGKVGMMFAIPENYRKDFGLKVTLVGTEAGPNDVRQFNVGDKLVFTVDTAKKAYIRLWTIDPDKNVATLLFPNEMETNNLIEAGTPRTIPDPNLVEDKKYVLTATPSTTVEVLRVEASSQQWPKKLQTPVEGGFQSLTLADAKIHWETTLRGIAMSTPLSESYIQYKVVPKK